MLVRVKASALRQTKVWEYAIRFVLGGLATVLAGVVASYFGPEAGGVFLAFPAIFCASATLVERHERQRKQRLGLPGRRRGTYAAALDAAGAALGSFGLLSFGAVIWGMSATAPLSSLMLATTAWLVIALTMWWLRRYVRVTRGRGIRHGAGPARRRAVPPSRQTSV